MSTIANTTNNVNASDATVKLVIPDSSGHTEIVLTIKEAALRALQEVKEHARWIFRTKKDDAENGSEPIYIDGKADDDAIEYLVGIFGDSKEVLLTTNLVGGYDDLEDDDADEEYVEETTDGILGEVKIVYVDDVNGKSAINSLLKYVPQLVVEVDPEGNTTVFVRNTDNAVDKIVSNAGLIYGALSKIEADDARP